MFLSLRETPEGRSASTTCFMDVYVLRVSVLVVVCSSSNPNTTGKPLPKRVEALSQKTQVFLLPGEESGSELAKEV